MHGQRRGIAQEKRGIRGTLGIVRKRWGIAQGTLVIACERRGIAKETLGMARDRRGIAQETLGIAWELVGQSTGNARHST